MLTTIGPRARGGHPAARGIVDQNRRRLGNAPLPEPLEPASERRQRVSATGARIGNPRHVRFQVDVNGARHVTREIGRVRVRAGTRVEYDGAIEELNGLLGRDDGPGNHAISQ